MNTAAENAALVERGHRPDPGRWVLTRHTGEDLTDDGEVVAVHSAAADEAGTGEAQAWATWRLFQEGVWARYWVRPATATDGDAGLIAITPDPVGAWTVTARRDRNQRTWHVGSEGVWRSLDGQHAARTEGLLEERHGPTAPLMVHNLAAMWAHLQICLAVSGYLVGPEACVGDYDCDDYQPGGTHALSDDDGTPWVPRYCSHVQHRIATRFDHLKLQAAEDTLDGLAEANALPGDDEMDAYTHGELNERAGVLGAIDQIREAIRKAVDDA